MTVRFPVFETIRINGYDLFPGKEGEGGVDVAFANDENLVLGVNGLGKSTLLLLLKQMIEGPLRSRASGFVGESQKNDFIAVDSIMFSVRAKDGARAASASVELRFGNERIAIKRNLRDLSLIEFRVGPIDGALTLGDRDLYQVEMARLANVNAFADVLRLCDRVVFFLENRERLLWEWQAQYEIFRSLLLPPQKAADLRALESKIISSDSAARNLRSAMHRLSTKRDREARKIGLSTNVLADLADVERDLEAAQTEEQRLVDEVDTRKVAVIEERGRSWKADSEEDEAATRYDQLKYAAIRHEMGNAPLSDQYVFLKLLNEGDCLVCGASGLIEFAEELNERQTHQLCIVCGSKRVDGPNLATTSAILAEQARQAFDQLKAIRAAARDAASRLAERQRD